MLLGMLAGGTAAGRVIDAGRLGSLSLVLPEGEVQQLVFLFSDLTGWNADLDRAAARLSGTGAAVLEVDLPAYLARLEREQRPRLPLSDLRGRTRQQTAAARARAASLPVADPGRHRHGLRARLRRARPGACRHRRRRGERRPRDRARHTAAALPRRTRDRDCFRFRLRAESRPARLVADRRAARAEGRRQAVRGGHRAGRAGRSPRWRRAG